MFHITISHWRIVYLGKLLIILNRGKSFDARNRFIYGKVELTIMQLNFDIQSKPDKFKLDKFKCRISSSVRNVPAKSFFFVKKKHRISSKAGCVPAYNALAPQAIHAR